MKTFGTIGFGHVYPATLAANYVITLEACVGLMGVALAWMVVHPLDEHSVFFGLNSQDLLRREAEIIVILRATDDTSHQTLLAPTSYHSAKCAGAKNLAPCMCAAAEDWR